MMKEDNKEDFEDEEEEKQEKKYQIKQEKIAKKEQENRTGVRSPKEQRDFYIRDIKDDEYRREEEWTDSWIQPFERRKKIFVPPPSIPDYKLSKAEERELQERMDKMKEDTPSIIFSNSENDTMERNKNFHMAMVMKQKEKDERTNEHIHDMMTAGVFRATARGTGTSGLQLFIY